MTYLPPQLERPVTGDTLERPQASQLDFRLHVRMIRERWDRFYPLLPYRVLLLSPTPAPPREENADPIVGAPGTTRFDPLWNESIDSSVGETWAQPHATTTTDATAMRADRFAPPVNVHARVTRMALDSDLHKYGFDRVRDLLVTIPTTYLDEFGITVKAGDVLVWDGDEYTVVQETALGFFYNTSVRLYVHCNCEHRRTGS
jgi:hypothetical protein